MITSPATSADLAAAPSRLDDVQRGFWSTGTSRRRCPDRSALLSAVAVLSRSPSPPPLLSISACVTRVRRRVGPGLADVEQRVVVADRVGAAHDRARIAYGSVTTTPVSVGLPVFCTVIV